MSETKKSSHPVGRGEKVLCVKVYDRPFFKKVAGSWDSGPSRARRRETPLHAVFNLRSKYVLLSCGYLLKKRTERRISACPLRVCAKKKKKKPVLFSTAGATKKL